MHVRERVYWNDRRHSLVTCTDQALYEQVPEEIVVVRWLPGYLLTVFLLCLFLLYFPHRCVPRLQNYTAPRPNYRQPSCSENDKADKCESVEIKKKKKLDLWDDRQPFSPVNFQKILSSSRRRVRVCVHVCVHGLGYAGVCAFTSFRSTSNVTMTVVELLSMCTCECVCKLTC